ncbi:MAG: hypothetical protein H0T96_10345 [Thermoleophilaceae bacterium]|nr:hypothetical protein [Thermoleophilaceae bacterium]MDQ3242099.1 hypothetical protein [Actinomycetota bacterium]
MWSLMVVLNSRVVDWVFRRGSVPFRGDFLSANKQFIAPLPIRLPSSAQVGELDRLGRRLHALTAEVAEEREGFLDWLGGVLGVHPRVLPGATALTRYENLDAGEILAILARSRARLGRDPDARAFGELLAGEHGASAERLGAHLSDLTAVEAEAERSIADLYELSKAQRALMDTDYESSAP